MNPNLKLLTQWRVGLPLKDLDIQAGKYIKKFNKEKYKVLHLKGNDPRLGDWLLGRKFVENKKLNKSIQGPLAVMKTIIS